MAKAKGRTKARARARMSRLARLAEARPANARASASARVQEGKTLAKGHQVAKSETHCCSSCLGGWCFHSCVFGLDVWTYCACSQLLFFLRTCFRSFLCSLEDLCGPLNHMSFSGLLPSRLRTSTTSTGLGPQKRRSSQLRLNFTCLHHDGHHRVVDERCLPQHELRAWQPLTR